jgi:predicted transposase YbfD/YdcC
VPQTPAGAIADHFSDLQDPRSDNRSHLLLDIIVIAICAAICDADTWTDVELFGQSKEQWFRKFLELPHGIPSHDTFSRVFALIDTEQFQESFRDWIAAVEERTEGEIVALDGKQLRRSHDKAKGKKAIYMVSAWASENSLVLGQRKVDDRSNEITAVPQLLDMLEVAGCIVTTDAMNCQVETAKKVIENDADYVFVVKENQPRLLETIQGLFDDPNEMRWVDTDSEATVDEKHGRTETRQCWTTSDPEYLAYIASFADWPGLRSIGMIEARRSTKEGTSIKRRYFISSLESNAKRLLHAVRTYWGIENKLHWVLDLAFREDESRIRKGNGPENSAVLRHIALNLLRREDTAKISIRAKRKKAGWDNDYLLKVLMA